MTFKEVLRPGLLYQLCNKPRTLLNAYQPLWNTGLVWGSLGQSRGLGTLRASFALGKRCKQGPE